MEPIQVDHTEQEIESVDHVPFVLSHIFDFVKPKNKKNKKELSPSMVILSGCIFLAGICLLVYSKDLVKFIKDAVNQMILELNDTEIVFPDAEHIEIDVDTFFNSVNVEVRKDATGKNIESFYKTYAEYEAFYEQIGIVLPESEDLHFNNITFFINESNRIGKVHMTAKYNWKSYYLTGYFGIMDYTPDDSNIYYEQEIPLATMVYEYGDNKKAYLLKRFDSDTLTFYFEADNIYYTFGTKDSDKAVEKAMEFIEAMSN